jgi:hypothetical protein
VGAGGAGTYYATVFFEIYSDPACEMLYVNCAYNPTHLAAGRETF